MDDRQDLPALVPSDLIIQLGAGEILRALRHQRLLTLTLLELPTAVATEPVPGSIGLLVRQRMRRSDLAGWLSDRRLVILLPETPAAGGAAFIRRLQQAGGQIESALAATAVCPEDGRSWEALLNAASARLVPFAMLSVRAVIAPTHERTSDAGGAMFARALGGDGLLVAVAPESRNDLQRSVGSVAEDGVHSAYE